MCRSNPWGVCNVKQGVEAHLGGRRLFGLQRHPIINHISVRFGGKADLGKNRHIPLRTYNRNMSKIDDFPIPNDLIPALLEKLLSVETNEHPDEMIDISMSYEHDMHGDDREYVHMTMAVVPERNAENVGVLSETRDGSVSFSIPCITDKGGLYEYSPSISGHDYIVASWKNGSFFSYHLAEKVWMSLGLSARCVGNDTQTLTYDDLSLPMFGIAHGDVSNEYYYAPKKNVSWVMRNDYLRKYLWMRGSVGMRVFFYEKSLPDCHELRALMEGKSHVKFRPKGSWYELDIREFKGNLLIQVWATAPSTYPELCVFTDVKGLLWPGNKQTANQRLSGEGAMVDYIYLDDSVLMKYETNKIYDTVPYVGGVNCNPSYGGQWSFEGMHRIGRNVIKVSIYSLYKGIPDAEILNARRYALDNSKLPTDFEVVENIVSKTNRFTENLLMLGDQLSILAQSCGITKTPLEITKLDRTEIYNNGWHDFPELCMLAQVAPSEMTQQDFLARCKVMHEVIHRVSTGLLKKLLEYAGAAKKDVSQLASLKLLERLLNIFQTLSDNDESLSAFENCVENVEWNRRNDGVKFLYNLNELRLIDAHLKGDDPLTILQTLGFDRAQINNGYGVALDYIFDGVIEEIGEIVKNISNVVNNT